MTWIIKDGCYGCAHCTYCNGIKMRWNKAKIVDQSSPCIEKMAKICPAGIIQKV